MFEEALLIPSGPGAFIECMPKGVFLISSPSGILHNSSFSQVEITLEKKNSGLDTRVGKDEEKSVWKYEMK